jgi:predicted TIM-barrel fold metal-dependent hydrolase
MKPPATGPALALLAAALLAGCSGGVSAHPIPLIDAHSQIEAAIAPERIVELMDAAGVSRTILSARHGTSVEAMVDFARRHPGRVTAAVRSKGEAYRVKPLRVFRAFLDKQAKFPEFAAIAEVLIFHAKKTNKKGKTIAPRVAFPPGHNKVAPALELALRRGWPFVAHIEFASLGAARESYMTRFEAMVRAHPDHPFVLIHMGQLGAGEVARLIAAHRNLYFITSHTTPVTLGETDEPWTAMFAGPELLPEWRALMVRHPGRFVLGFDNVWARHWEKFYLPQVRLWRSALAALPDGVAHAVAHGNAERLWNLPPAK